MTGAYVDKFSAIAPKKIPIGDSLVLLGGFGVAGGLDRILRNYLPAGYEKWGSVALGIGLAYLWKNVGVFRNFVGESGTTALAIGSLVMPIERALGIQTKISNAVASLSPGVITAGAPAKTGAPAEVKTAAAPEVKETVFASPVGEKLRATLARL